MPTQLLVASSTQLALCGFSVMLSLSACRSANATTDRPEESSLASSANAAPSSENPESLAKPQDSSNEVYWPMCCSYAAIECNMLEPIPSDLSKCGAGIEADPELVRFAVIGDFGDASFPCEAKTAAMIKGWESSSPLDFIMTLGDNNYNNGAERTFAANVTQFFGDYVSSERFYPTLGNHDWRTRCKKEEYPPNGIPCPYVEHFSYLAPLGPEGADTRYYTTNIKGIVDLYGLDSNPQELHGTCCNSTQANWFSNALLKSKAPFRLAYFHHSPYTTAQVDSPGSWMRWPFNEWGVSAVLSGHEHAYERLDVDGIPYFVNGLGGSPWIYNQDQCPRDKHSNAMFTDTIAAMYVVANSKEMEFCAYRVDQADPVDVYRIKGSSPPTAAPAKCVPSPVDKDYCANEPATVHYPTVTCEANSSVD